MKSNWRFLIIPLTVTVGVLGGSPVAGQEQIGSITGFVFDDLNGDGLRDEGEPGLPDKMVTLVEDETLQQAVRTDADGSYSMDGLAPGEYILDVVLRSGAVLCAEHPVSFNPLLTSWCFNFTLPWHVMPDPVPVTVEDTAVHEVDLGAQPVHVAVVAGIALLEDNRAPPGTLIEALVGGQECGRTLVLDDREFNFGLNILGAREREGCATLGNEVEFRVGGVPAAATVSWAPFAYSTGFGFLTLNLVAVQEHAWYWFETTEDGLPSKGTVVQALVGGNVCGEATINVWGEFMAGFSRLIVPSETLQPGCGRPGTTVSFLVGGVMAETTALWEPGIRRIDLILSGDVNCDLTLNSIDAALILQLEVGLTASLGCDDTADVNGDGTIDGRDAALILQLDAGLIERLPL